MHRMRVHVRHIGAAFSLILDEKMALGLAAPPLERVPVESLSERELIENAIERTAGTGASRTHDGESGGCGTAVDGLHGREHNVGQVVSRLAAGKGVWRRVLFVSRIFGRIRSGPASTSCTFFLNRRGDSRPPN